MALLERRLGAPQGGPLTLTLTLTPTIDQVRLKAVRVRVRVRVRVGVRVRANPDPNPNQVRVKVVLETLGKAHNERILAALRDAVTEVYIETDDNESGSMYTRF